MVNRGLAAGLGWFAAVLLGFAGTSDAARYQIQVASVPEHVFRYFVKDRTLPGIEAYLDDTQRSKFVVFRDRPPQLLEPVTEDPAAPGPVDVQLPKRNHPWGAVTWDGEAGHIVVFRIRGPHSNYQKLARVAVQTDGALTRFPVHGVPNSRQRRMAAPATAANYLAHAIQSRTLVAWVDRYAVSHGGLSVIVGRHHNAEQADTVYLVVRAPSTGKAYKIVLGWEDMEQRGVNINGQGSHN